MSHNTASHHIRSFVFAPNSQGGNVMKNACLSFITVNRGIKTKEKHGAGGGGWGGWRRGEAAGDEVKARGHRLDKESGGFYEK